MECQEHPPVWGTPLPAAPQSGGAQASSWPTPQWFESPSHLLHLGGTTGKLNCQSLKKKRWIMGCCIANLCWTSPPDDHATVPFLRSGWHICSGNQVCEICDTVRKAYNLMCGVTEIGSAENITCILVQCINVNASIHSFFKHS